MFICVSVWGYTKGVCVEFWANFWLLVLTLHLVWDRVSLFTTMWAGLQASGISHVSTFQLLTDAHGNALWTWTSLCLVFTWALGIWTQTVRFAWEELCPLSHIPSLIILTTFKTFLQTFEILQIFLSCILIFFSISMTCCTNNDLRSFRKTKGT